jgi:hypothetical protein
MYCCSDHLDLIFYRESVSQHPRGRRKRDQRRKLQEEVESRAMTDGELFTHTPHSPHYSILSTHRATHPTCENHPLPASAHTGVAIFLEKKIPRNKEETEILIHSVCSAKWKMLGIPLRTISRMIKKLNSRTILQKRKIFGTS